MKLDFLVAGFGKCGTTSLCSLLADHPDVYIPERKETAFFAFNYFKGWEWYEGLFKDAAASQAWGEGSTYYSAEMFERQSCQRILEHFPEVRLIFIARDPIARLESYYRELHHSGHIIGIDVPFTIEQTLDDYPHLIHDTLYWRRISTYRKYVPDSRIHVLFLEDFTQQPALALARCFEFLGVDPSARIADVHRRLNAGSTKLYDTKLMRIIRAYRPIRRLWKTLPVRWQDRLGRKLGLRKPFEGPVQWPAGMRDRVLREIGKDAQQFLAFYGKPADYWDLSPASVSAQPQTAAA